MAKPEPDFAWKKIESLTVGDNQVHRLELTSQKWQNIVWKHALIVYEPKTLTHRDSMLLFVTGGSIGKSPNPKEMGMGVALANLSGARVATLHQVPNQPLMGNRVEDDLITETWLKYLETGDATWPLLFPMAKSAVKAMDALEQFSSEHYKQPLKGFVITGASKRGWTSWLTPVADSRIVATAPMVIDTLNFKTQMQHQLDSWGAFSVQIKDYTSKGLIVLDRETARERQLRLMMDPYTYRQQLTLPKLLVNGTNDPYWVVDAMTKYWYDLSGPTYALQIPNAGHGLNGGEEKTLRTIGAFARHVASNTALPELSWQIANTQNQQTLTVTSSTTPTSVTLWSVESADLDFRDDEWRSEKMQPSEASTWTGTVKSDKRTAVFAELTFEIQGVPYSLCSLIFRR